MKLGSSNRFKLVLRKFHTNKSNKNLDLENIFSGNVGQTVFSKIRQGSRTPNFEKTYHSKNNSLKICPPIFEYNSKIGIHDTIVPEKLREISDLLKSSKTNTNDINKIRKFLADIEPQIAESDVFDELVLFFYNHRGIILHGYQPRNFLKVFVDIAADNRKRAKSKDRKLTELEKKILFALNIKIEDVEATADKIVTELKYEGPTINSFSTSKIHEKINELEFRHLPPDFKGTALNKFKYKKSYSQTNVEDLKNRTKNLNLEGNKLKSNLRCRNEKPTAALKDEFYDPKEIKEAIMFSIYETESKFSGEWDFLVVLPDHKCIINVEVKNNRDSDSKNSNLRCAAQQLKEHAEYMARVHGIVLSEDWSFLKLAAIVPRVVDDSNVCDHCKSYIISDSCKISTIWNNLPLFTDGTIETKKMESDREYEFIFDRLVHFSSAVQQPNSKIENIAWKQIQGDCTNNISSGYTSTDSTFNSSLDTLPSFSDIRRIPHNASKILYFNPEQIGLLTKRILLFLCDYGSGKQFFNWNTFEVIKFFREI